MLSIRVVTSLDLSVLALLKVLVQFQREFLSLDSPHALHELHDWDRDSISLHDLRRDFQDNSLVLFTLL